jgi:hypothetical protein
MLLEQDVPSPVTGAHLPRALSRTGGCRKLGVRGLTNHPPELRAKTASNATLECKHSTEIINKSSGRPQISMNRATRSSFTACVPLPCTRLPHRIT